MRLHFHFNYRIATSIFKRKFLELNPVKCVIFVWETYFKSKKDK